MKPRHAAALALVVCYMMYPPLTQDQFGRWHAETNTPLLKWNFYTARNDFTRNDRAHAFEFKTYDECEHERKGTHDGWFGTNRHRGLKDILAWGSTLIEARTEVVTYETCIASDDPRLKEK